MRILANVATKDSFDPDLTLEQDDAFTLSFVVANASAIVRLRAGRRQSGGDNSYGLELLFTP